MAMALGWKDARIDNSGISLPTSFGGALDGFKAGFTDDYDRAFIGSPSRITRDKCRVHAWGIR